MPRVDNKGVSIHYRVEGNGPPLVLVPGITDSSETWSARLRCSIEAENRLILIDARHRQATIPMTSIHTPGKERIDIGAVLDDLGVKTAGLLGGCAEDGWGFPRTTCTGSQHVPCSAVRPPAPPWHTRLCPEKKTP